MTPGFPGVVDFPITVALFLTLVSFLLFCFLGPLHALVKTAGCSPVLPCGGKRLGRQCCQQLHAPVASGLLSVGREQ